MKILVTAGPTRERLDPVRFISNRSSGKMGYAIACAAKDAGHEVTLELIPELKEIDLDFIGVSQLEIMVKYEGYIKREEKEALSFAKYEEHKLPQDIDYLNMHGLALEARQKLDKIRPINIGQAGRISGVNPSDISILILNLKKKEK